MQLKICENPVKVFNKFTHRFEYMKCGKCNTCRNIRNATWTDRLIQESQCFPYTVFFTLTFDDHNVPMLSLDPDGHSLVDVHSSLVVDLNDLPNYSNMSPLKRRLYVHKRKFIPYVTSDVAQRFVKRLRYYFNTLLLHTNENKTLRYFIVSEYGPSTYRPHLHGLLFFFSRSFASRYEGFLSKAWSFGRVDSSFVRDSAASYVARYIDSNKALPRIYLHKQIRPFLLCSKQPPIGTLLCTTEEVKEIFYKGATKRIIHDYKRNKFKDVPLWRSLKSKLFPKIQCFDSFNHSQRVALYGCYKYSGSESFSDFAFWALNIVNQGSEFGLDNRSFLGSYLTYLFSLDSLSSRPQSYFALRNFYYVCKRVFLQASVFNVDLDFYVDRIENFYSLQSLENLKEFYEFQSDFMRLHRDTRLLLFLYHDYSFSLIDRLSSNGSYLMSYDINILSQFGFNLSHVRYDYVDSALDVHQLVYYELCSVRYHFDDLSESSRLFNLKIFNQSLKNKKKNDYLHWIENNDYYSKNFNFNFFKEYA